MSGPDDSYTVLSVFLALRRRNPEQLELSHVYSPPPPPHAPEPAVANEWLIGPKDVEPPELQLLLFECETAVFYSRMACLSRELRTAAGAVYPPALRTAAIGAAFACRARQWATRAQRLRMTFSISMSFASLARMNDSTRATADALFPRASRQLAVNNMHHSIVFFFEECADAYRLQAALKPALSDALNEEIAVSLTLLRNP